MVEYLRQGTTERALLQAAARPPHASAGRAGAAGGSTVMALFTRSGFASSWPLLQDSPDRLCQLLQHKGFPQ